LYGTEEKKNKKTSYTPPKERCRKKKARVVMDFGVTRKRKRVLQVDHRNKKLFEGEPVPQVRSFLYFLRHLAHLNSIFRSWLGDIEKGFNWCC
jgi:hypothetical protein